MARLTRSYIEQHRDRQDTPETEQGHYEDESQFASALVDALLLRAAEELGNREVPSLDFDDLAVRIEPVEAVPGDVRRPGCVRICVGDTRHQHRPICYHKKPSPGD